MQRNSDTMKVGEDLKRKGRGLRKCRICGNSRGMIRSYKLYVCRRCFREIGGDLGFRKLS